MLGKIVNFFGFPRIFTGIDISPSAIKLLTLTQEKWGYRLCSVTKIPLTDSVTNDDEIWDSTAILSALQIAVKKLNLIGKDAALALTDSSVILHEFEIEGPIAPNLLEPRVYQEAKKYIVYPLDEVKLDFKVIKPRNSMEKSKVIFAAARSNIIDNWVRFVEEAGLVVKLVEVKSFALARACKLLDNQFQTGPQHPCNTLGLLELNPFCTT